nr:uncharacterized protein LOC129381282 [Dermacentor andersoni]
MSGFARRLWLRCQNLNMVGRGSTHTAEQVAACLLAEEDGAVCIQGFLQAHAQSVNGRRPGTPLPVSRSFHVAPFFRLQHESPQASGPFAVQSVPTLQRRFPARRWRTARSRTATRTACFVGELQRPSLDDAAAHNAQRREENALSWHGRACSSRGCRFSVPSLLAAQVRALS